MPKIWMVADLHLGHDRLWMQNWRPKGFSERLVTNILKVLHSGDILINLGDTWFGMGKSMLRDFHSEAAKRISPGGALWLIRGNHDSFSIFAGQRLGFQAVIDGIYLKVFGKRVLLTHKPQPLAELTKYHYNIHGHLHANFHREGGHTEKHIEISMELLGYRPVTLEKVLKLGGTPERLESGKLIVTKRFENDGYTDNDQAVACRDLV